MRRGFGVAAMPENPIHHPHDKLFKVGFSLPENAAAFLREELPAPVAQAVDWSRLRLEPGSFIDSHLRLSTSDLLFSAPLGDGNCLVYILFEHQTREDSMLALRLLRYMVRIWETWQRSQPAGARLPTILPVVLAHDSKPWKLSREFASLFEVPVGHESDMAPFVPDFCFQLIELATRRFEGIPGTPTGVVILRTMKAERSGDWFAELVWDEALMIQLPDDILDLVFRYMFRADIDKERFRSRVNSILAVELKTKAMTLADQLLAEGLEKGIEKGIEKGLRKGIQTALEVRFGDVPEDLSLAIKEIYEVVRLERLLRVAIDAASLDDFRLRI